MRKLRCHIGLALALCIPSMAWSQGAAAGAAVAAPTGAASSGARIEAAAPYIDRVINEKEAAEEPKAAMGEQGPEPRGRRSFSAIYSLSNGDYSNGAGHREQGAEFRGQRETQDYGVFDYIASGYAAHDSAAADSSFGSTLGSKTAGQRLTLSQTRFALNGTQVMDNALGAVYTQGSPLLSRSFRTSLVSSPVLGLSSRVYDNSGTEFNFASGRIGQFSGSTASGFGATQGEMTGVGLQRRIDGQWALGGQAWVVKGAAGVADHTSVGLVGDYASADGVRRLQLRGIADDRGRAALWFDGEQHAPTLLHHYGVFRFDKDVAWADYPVAGGQQGVYWRADGRGLGQGYSMGAEYTESNFQHDASQAVVRSASAFGTVNQRIDRLSSVGGTLNLRMTQTLAAANAVDTPNANVNHLDGVVFASRQTALGASRLQFNYGASLAGGGDRSQGVQLDQELGKLGLAATLAYADEYADATGRTQRATAALLFRGTSFGDAFLSGNLNVYQQRSATQGTENGTQAAASLRWQLGRSWSAQSSLSWRRTHTSTLSTLGNAASDEKLLMVTLRYDTVGGIPYYASNTTGPTASARIEGTVFFDENADGARQAAEKPAVGVTVVLDNVYRAVTDANGRYEFSPIGPGTHRLTLQVDRVPLPWGLLDDAPRAIEAPVRGAAQVPFALTRLNQ